MSATILTAEAAKAAADKAAAEKAGEWAKVIELEPVPVEVQHRIEQDRRVTCGEHEPIAIRPLRIGGVVAHDA